MEVILSRKCESFTGSLGKSYGYFIRKQNGKFISIRSRHPPIPCDGHWRFIVKCAELAMIKLYFADIRVSGQEIIDALYEAGFPLPKNIDPKYIYNASEFKQFIKQENR